MQIGGGEPKISARLLGQGASPEFPNLLHDDTDTPVREKTIDIYSEKEEGPKLQPCVKNKGTQPTPWKSKGVETGSGMTLKPRKAVIREPPGQGAKTNQDGRRRPRLLKKKDLYLKTVA